MRSSTFKGLHLALGLALVASSLTAGATNSLRFRIQGGLVVTEGGPGSGGPGTPTGLVFQKTRSS